MTNITRTNESYPHPVLSTDTNDIRGEYNPSLDTVELKKRSIAIDANQLLPEHNGIRSLIENRKADVCIRFYCPLTYVRETHQVHEDRVSLALRADRYYRTVTCQISVCATREIQGYDPEGKHADYEGYQFDIQRGQILATGPNMSFYAEKNFDPLKARARSILTVRKRPDLDGVQPYHVVLDTEKIEIHLDETSYRDFIELCDIAPELLHTSIVVPALAEAIRSMNDPEYQLTRWSERLHAILESRDLSIKDPLSTAQKLLEDPFHRSARELIHSFESMG